MELIFLWKFVHVLGACVLLGAGLGIAFFMFTANRTRHPGVIAVTTRIAVVANLTFITAGMAVLLLSGWALARAIGLFPLEESWIVLSMFLYLFVLLCWLPATPCPAPRVTAGALAPVTPRSAPPDSKRCRLQPAITML